MNQKEKKNNENKTKQTTRTESEKWTSYGGISVGKGKGRMEGMIQGRRSIINRHKIYQER